MEVNGTTRGTQYDGINTAGAVTYGGALTIHFGAASAAGTTYDLFNTGAPTGDFTSVALTGSHTVTLVNNAGVWTGADDGLTFTFTDSTGNLVVTGSGSQSYAN